MRLGSRRALRVLAPDVLASCAPVAQAALARQAVKGRAAPAGLGRVRVGFLP